MNQTLGKIDAVALADVMTAVGGVLHMSCLKMT
jgi:hypothetical protein